MGEKRQTILYVDDDQDYLDAVRTILESAEYEMLEAHTAEEGLKVFAAEQADVVIVDLMMEEVDSGTRFMRDLRAMGGQETPIYMLTAVGDTMFETVDAGDLGLAGVFQKPIDGGILLQVLRSKLALAEE